MTAEEIKFLEAIKNQCQLELATNKILASVIAAQAIHESNFGKVDHVQFTNNLFRMPVDDDWNGKCYSLEAKQLYMSKIDAEPNDTLVKAYDFYDQSIDDFVHYIMNDRKSENGPFRYKQVIGIKDPTKCVKAFIRCGYLKNHLAGYQDPTYESTIIGFIDACGLREWDNAVWNNEVTPVTYSVKELATDTESLLNSHNLSNAKSIASNNRGYKVYTDEKLVFDPWVVDETSPMYRTRLEWDNPESQLVAAKILIDAKAEADKHPGYKVFSGDEGTLIYDPWKKEDASALSNPEANETAMRTPLILQVGKMISLVNMPVYRHFGDKNPFTFVSGEYYVYDGKKINGRTRISKTNDPNLINGKCPKCIYGFIDLY